MFKKIVFFLAGISFAGFILLLSLKSGASRLSFAAATLKYTVTSESTTPSAELKVDYYLPYPGILPDHFLYRVKMVRDKIKAFLTNHPDEKAYLYLLYSDKRIGAGKVLIEGNKVPLGLSTLLKGEKYLELAVIQASRVEDKTLDDKLSMACQKHREIFLELKDKVDSSGATAIEDLLKFNKLLQEQIIMLSSQFSNK